ncbi:hypothetical protein [Pseudomonas cavernae]|uniref:hypothetical protein n=1 Tax=Pseudomonas cavernae TaxID=2320867 RepID=UPI0013C4527E|nr:hypothetical protein [Pseudomonas cavernae]
MSLVVGEAILHRATAGQNSGNGQKGIEMAKALGRMMPRRSRIHGGEGARDAFLGE